MHEVSIMESAMRIVKEKAEENNIKNIFKITIKIGELCGVMSDSLIFAFNSLSKETIAEGAEFLIEKVKATAMCNDCGTVFEIDHFNKLCPNCNKFSTNILSGYELYVNTIEGE
ncbi:hydrogenase maturation nickel metallochaperone HypA [Clostridium sp. DJ247]|uniref:hydrogenase maturation nickel metallochaperone HypA n=1 Tax=Clostridium sp. DJ247 TaxID=2726188 RepID=UPI001624867E|nr:hydrogenase maturation nickel metallochaperone HypA [Clostridium sp. DJ247]MBC2580089.1 hydrogenase maturation nickel metallochaperone HypA [Clostridium sp. DJ247]